MFSIAGYMLNSKRPSMAPYKVDVVLFIHDNFDVVCSHPASHIIVIVNEQHHVKCTVLNMYSASYVLTSLTCTVAQH